MMTSTLRRLLDRVTPGPLLLGILFVYYGLLQNGCWRPSPDAALYVATARNILLGRGITFAGHVVTLAPPIWPMVLAGAMAISASFWVLNGLLMALCMLFGWLSYRVLRRLTTPWRAFGATLLAMVLFEWYELSSLLLSDALMGVLMMSCILLGLEIAEGRRAGWRTVLLLALCVVMVLVRWAGALAWVMVAGALLSGQLRPRINRNWALVALSAVLVVAGFAGARWGLRMESRRVQRAIALATQPSVVTQPVAGEPVAAAPQGVFVPSVEEAVSPNANLGKLSWTVGAEQPRLVGRRTWGFVGYRLATLGRWIPRLFWPVFSSKPIDKVYGADNIIGWGMLACFLVAMPGALRARNWLYLGTLGYLVVLSAWCTRPVARYLVVVAPLLILGMLDGLAVLRDRFGSVKSMRVALKTIAIVWVGSTLLANVTLWAVDVWVAQGGKYYDRFHGGEDGELVDIAAYLNQQGIHHWQVAINESRIDVSGPQSNTPSLRLLYVMTGRCMGVLPTKTATVPQDPKAAAWAVSRNVRYVVWRPDTSPWRLWHFRMPAYQQWRTHELVAWRPMYELYEVTPTGLSKVELVRRRDWQDHVWELPGGSGGLSVSR